MKSTTDLADCVEYTEIKTVHWFLVYTEYRTKRSAVTKSDRSFVQTLGGDAEIKTLFLPSLPSMGM